MKILQTALQVALLCSGVLLAQVGQFTGNIQLDGILDEAAWQNCPLHSGFTRLEAANTKKLPEPTEFRVATDRDTLYIGFRCQEPLMDKIVAPPQGPPWSVDSIELFMAPGGQPDEFYQFVVTAGNMQWCMYYAESGNIRPDPYAPLWESSVFHGDDFWSAEVRIPLSAFYMTRTEKWSTEWLFNIGRCRRPVNESSSWSPLQVSFHETTRFKRLKGFPVRQPTQDIYLQSVQAADKSINASQKLCDLELEILANPAAAGAYSLSCGIAKSSSFQNHPVSLRAGSNRVTVPAVPFAILGRNDMVFEFRNATNGFLAAGRIYPVQISYCPLEIQLDQPTYAMTFFPGQDRSEIRGRLELQMDEATLAQGTAFLELVGTEIPKQQLDIRSLDKSIPFRFATPGLPEGQVTINAEIRMKNDKVASASARIRIPAPSKQQMAWLENGHLVINGKPLFPRDIYAIGWQGGTAFKRRFENDHLFSTKNLICVLEPFRLVGKHIEQEAVKDIRPSPIVFEKIAARMQSMQDKDFTFYYLSDEPECRGLSAVYFRHLYEFVKEKDPFHPVLIGSRAAGEFISCADVISTHPYLGPMSDGRGNRFLNVPLHRVRDFVRPVSNLKRPDKMIGLTPQFFSYGNITNYLGDYPDFRELECSIWSGIANGARMMWAYAYHDLGDRPTLYEGMRFLYQSIENLEEKLLLGQAQEVHILEGNKDMLDVQLLEREENLTLIVVNLQNAAAQVTLSSEMLRNVSILHGYRENNRYPINNGLLKLTLVPYQVVIMTKERIGTDLETRETFMQRLAALEKARGERGNLLFGKGYTIEIDSSGPVPRNRLLQQGKLFDGTLDVLGWSQYPGPKTAWLEISFPKWVPEFSKIRIHGHGLDNATVSIWKAGDWLKPEAKELEETLFSREWSFPNSLRTVKIRFDFTPPKQGEVLELYEIELLK
ncbi:MAG: hypothetical protein GX927_00325 [Lentisphaerae bacterium]|jgi:hypothetical protein|nr:hypothetical protein [Lentisphaerota bacterium]